VEMDRRGSSAACSTSRAPARLPPRCIARRPQTLRPAAAAVAPPLTFDRKGLNISDGRLALKNLTLVELQDWLESIGRQ
jgi:hypothetical protein